MRENFEILFAAFLHALFILALIFVSLIAAAFVIVGLFGTGALTSSPPPEHPAYFGVALALLIWAATFALIRRLRRWVFRKLDLGD